MSRYYYLILLIVIFIVSGCGLKQNSIQPNSVKILDNNLTDHFSQEDTLTLYALDASERGRFKEAYDYYSKVYNITGKAEHAAGALKCAIIIKDYDGAKALLEKVVASNHSNAELNRYLIAYYLDKKMHKEAKALTDAMVKQERSARNLELSALVFDQMDEPKIALKLYEEAYQKDKSAYALLKMTDILYIKMKQKDKAARMLETHTSLNGCSEIICARLIQFYTKADDKRGIERVLKKLYKNTQNPAFAQKLMQLYASTKNYDKAIEFLKQTDFDDLVLLDIYIAKKDYKSALSLANQLYEKSKDPDILAKTAILEYESNSKTYSKKLFQSVMQKFDKVVDVLQNPLYYNYYGYLLIDHDIDVDRGIELVKKALLKEPDSHYYIDTLAWGLYKKGNCKDAYKLLAPVAKISDEEEIKDHIKTIKQCLDKEVK